MDRQNADDLFDRLPDELLPNIFDRVLDARSLCCCYLASKRFDMAISYTNTLCLQIPIWETVPVMLEDSVRRITFPVNHPLAPEAPRPVRRAPIRRNSIRYFLRNVSDVFQNWSASLTMKNLLGFFNNLSAGFHQKALKFIPKFSTLLLRPRDPPPPHHLNQLYLRSGFNFVFLQFLSSFTRSFLPKLSPLRSLEINFSFPERPEHGLLVKWSGVFQSANNFHFILFFTDHLHELAFDYIPEPQIEFGNVIGRKMGVSYKHFTNFYCNGHTVRAMRRPFGSLNRLKISYSRRLGTALMRQECDNDFFGATLRDVAYARRRIWTGSMLPLPDHGLGLEGFAMTIIVGAECVVDDVTIIQEAFGKERSLYDAAMAAYAMVDPRNF